MLPDIARTGRVVTCSKFGVSEQTCTEAFFAEFPLCSLPKAVEKKIAKQVEVCRMRRLLFLFERGG
jgi:hypothetical protein